MDISLFDFTLPQHYIAQRPAEPRDHAKLMVIKKSDKTITHSTVKDIGKFLPDNTLIVRNNTKVIKARLKGTFSTGGKWEIFFLSQRSKKSCMALIKPGKKFKAGNLVSLFLPNGRELLVQVREAAGMERELVFLNLAEPIGELFSKEGELPLPPYVDANPEEMGESYQTTYAKVDGSVAAPTAGLHFTKELTSSLDAMGHDFVDITLHVGLGTFLPIQTENILDHTLHHEEYFVGCNSLTAMRDAKLEKRPIMTVGTTSTRVTEHIFKTGEIDSKEDIHGKSGLYIHPPFDFKGVDILMTNFHLPKTSLLVLVSTFIGDREFTLKAYEEAKQHDYRFYSFGDAMLILP